MASFILFGLLSFREMGVSELPDVDLPLVSIRANLEGAAPQVIETQVIDPIESAVLSIEGIKALYSSAREGRGDVSIEFELSKNINVAVQEIQAKLAEAQRSLPTEMDPVVIRKRNPEDRPILWLSISSSKLSNRELMSFVRDRIRDQFTKIEGVAEVNLGGYVDPNLRVWVLADKLRQYDLTVQDVLNAINREHIELPAGRLEQKDEEFTVRVLGEAGSLEEFENILINQRGGSLNYRPVRLKDIARIEEGLGDIRRISRTNGEPSIGLGIIKERGSNAVAVAERVKERLKTLQPELSDVVDISVNFDSTQFIKESIDELIFTLFLSAFLTALVCWIFLGSWTATLNILLSIPTSVIGSFIVLSYLNFTLNTFTLLGLSLAIGIVVDDSIMVLENIFRHLQKGKNRTEAALFGTREVALAAMAATAAIIAIFLPVAFMKGVIGRYFFEFGVTISVAVAISLIEALTLTPMRCSQFVGTGERRTRFGKACDAFFEKLTQLYAKALPYVLRHPWKTVIMALLLFSISLLSLNFLRREFVPAQDTGNLALRIKTKQEASLSFTDQKVRQIEDILRKQPEVEKLYVSIGGFGGGEVNTGVAFVTLKDYSERPRRDSASRPLSQQEFTSILRQEFKNISDTQVFIQDSSGSSIGGRRGYPVEFFLKGPDWDELVKLSEVFMRKMEESGKLTDINSDFIGNVSEVQVIPDRKAASRYGVAVVDISKTLNALVGGVVAGLYTQDGKRYDIRVRLEEDQRDQISDFQSLLVRNSRGELIPLSRLVEIKKGEAPQTISRVDRERAISISANVGLGSSQAEAIREVERIGKEILSEPYYLSLGGSSETFQESFQSLIFALILGLIVSYMVLASQFNSFIHPFTVLMAFPFGVSGAFLALLIWSQSLNIYSMIGLILLAGLVKKNSILLVDFTIQRKEKGMGTMEALLEACPIRLRPILMTSFATIAAAVPASLNLGPGSESRIPMAVTVIGGMLASTVLTLFVVPCVFKILDRSGRSA